MKTRQFYAAMLVILPFVFLGSRLFADTNIQLTSSISDISYSEKKGYDVVSLPDCLPSQQVGAPQLPVRGVSLVAPQDVRITGVKILSFKKERMEGSYNVIPAQPIVPIGETAPWVEPDEKIYSSSEPYPGRLVELTGDGYMGGYHIVNLLVYPNEYIPAKKELYLFTEVSFEVQYQATPRDYVKPNRLSLENQEMYKEAVKNLVENPMDVEQCAPFIKATSGIKGKLDIKGSPSLEGSPVEYVIITNDEMASAFQQLADWKTKKGTPAVVKTISWIQANYPNGCDLAETIRNFIRDAYQNWGTVWVLLGGDTEVIPERYGFIVYPNWKGTYIVTDLYYSDLDGNWNYDGDTKFGEAIEDNVDLYPEVFVGRAPVHDSVEANDFIEKLFSYEKNSQHSNYQTKLLLLGENMFSEGDGGRLCDSATTYVPDAFTKTKLYDDSLGTENRQTVLNALNEGYGLILNYSHGSYDVINVRSNPREYIYNQDMDELSNNDRYSVMYSVTCYANAIDHDCFSEHFILNPNGGGVGYIGSTHWDFPFTAVWQNKEFFKELFTLNTREIGKISVNSRLVIIPWAYDNYSHIRWLYFSYLLLGDPQMEIWTDTPKEFSVSYHPSVVNTGDTTVTVHVEVGQGDPTGKVDPNDVPGAVVCLMKGDEYYAVDTTNSSGNVTFQFSPETPGEASLVVSKHNFFPSEKTIEVVTNLQSPSLYISDYSIDDVTWGNGNGILEAGEKVDLYLTLRNSGKGRACNVGATVSCDDGYVSLLADSNYYGNIDPGQSVALPYTLEVAPNCPDEYKLNFVLNMVEEGGGKSGYTVTRDIPGMDFRDDLPEYPDCDPPSAPSLSSPSNGATIPDWNNIILDWNSSSGASYYRLQVDNNSNFSSPEYNRGGIHATKDTVDLANGTEYWWRVKAYKSGSCASSWSSKWSFTTTNLSESWKDQLILKVYAPSVAHLGHIVDDYVGDGDGVAEKIECVKLSILLKNSGHGFAEGVWAYLSTPMSDIYISDSTEYFGQIQPDSGVWRSDAFDFCLLRDPPYLFTLNITDSHGLIWSQDFELSPPSPPGGISYLPDLTGIELFWEKPSDPDLAGYDVYRRDDGGSYGKVNRDLIEGTSYYHDTNLEIDKAYDYLITALDSSGNQSNWSDTLTAATNPQYQPGWPVTLDGLVFSSPAIVDLDNDGKKEILITSLSNKLYCWRWDGSSYIAGNDGIFALGDDSASFWASPAVGDIDGDGTLDVVIASAGPDRKVYAWDKDGVPLPNWPVQIDSSSMLSSPALGDLDGDGDLEVVVCAKDGIVYAWHPDGSGVMNSDGGFAVIGGKYNYSTPAIGDLDGNGDLEVVVDGRDGKVHAWDGDGEEVGGKGSKGYADELVGFPVIIGDSRGDQISASPALADLDPNHSGLEIVVLTDGHMIYVLHNNGIKATGWPVSVPGAGPDDIPGSPAVGDVDGDGQLDVVCAVRDRVYAWDWQGQPLVGWPVERASSVIRVNSSPILGDIDGDGDIEVLAASADERLYAWNSDGSQVLGWPVVAEWYLASTPAISDLDGDGDVEVVFSAHDKVFVWDLSGTYSQDRMVWPTFHHDVCRTGLYGSGYGHKFGSDHRSQEEGLPKSFELSQNYPNPFNPVTQIRYALPVDCEVKLEIYNILGQRVVTLVDGEQKAGYKTVRWDASSFSSGIYFFRIEAGDFTKARKMILLR